MKKLKSFQLKNVGNFTERRNKLINPPPPFGMSEMKDGTAEFMKCENCMSCY